MDGTACVDGLPGLLFAYPTDVVCNQGKCQNQSTLKNSGMLHPTTKVANRCNTSGRQMTVGSRFFAVTSKEHSCAFCQPLQDGDYHHAMQWQAASRVNQARREIREHLQARNLFNNCSFKPTDAANATKELPRGQNFFTGTAPRSRCFLLGQRAAEAWRAQHEAAALAACRWRWQADFTF